MRRVITGFIVDETGDWVAELSCGHDQHVRHRPPFQDRAWVERDDTRSQRIGTVMLCPLCDRGELPQRLRLTPASDTWDCASAPAALGHPHQLSEGVWGVIKVESGRLRFVARGEVTLDRELGPGSAYAIAPGLEHALEVREPARFSIDFYCVDPGRTTTQSKHRGEGVGLHQGGDSACWAHLVCPVCRVMLEGEEHSHEGEPEPDAEPGE